MPSNYLLPILGLLSATCGIGGSNHLPGQDAQAVVAVVHKSNPVTALSAAQLRLLYIGEVRQWPDHRRVTLVQSDPDSSAFRGLLQIVLQMTAADYNRFALNLEFRGAEQLPLKTLHTTEAACNFVFNVPGAVGVVDPSALSSPACKDRVRILPVVVR